MVENHYDFINVKAHRNSQAIEDKLKEMAEKENVLLPYTPNVYVPSADFNVIYLIHYLGLHFAGENITLCQLLDWGLFLQNEGDKVHWDEVTPFLKQMGIWTIFNQINAICEDYMCIELPYSISVTVRNKDLEIRIVEDLLHPEFTEEKPKSLLPGLCFKMKRWWYNRWKHPLVYNEWLLPMFLIHLWCHLRRVDAIKD